MTFNKISILKKTFPVLLGGILGYAYYYYIGCSNGCPIQSNPYASTIYGALLGGVFSIPSKKKKEYPQN